MSIDSLIRQATGEAARAAERVRKAEAMLKQRVDGLERHVNGQAHRAAQWIDTATGHIDRAGKLAASASAALNRMLPATEAAAIRRGTGVLSAAADQFAASGIGAIREAGGRLQVSAAGLGRKLGMFSAARQPARPGAAPAVKSSAELKPAAPRMAHATSATAHLLTLMPPQGQGEGFHFALSATAFDTLRRHTAFGIDSVPRLGRPDAAQAVGQGSETLTLGGAVYLARRIANGKGAPGADELEQLRRLGLALKPLALTMGSGEVLGRWYMTSLAEERSHLIAGGHARKQTYTLEFKRYGDDYQKL
jgi:phage protein U